jgi:hypothetical protein
MATAVCIIIIVTAIIVGIATAISLAQDILNSIIP